MKPLACPVYRRKLPRAYNIGPLVMVTSLYGPRLPTMLKLGRTCYRCITVVYAGVDVVFARRRNTRLAFDVERTIPFDNMVIV